MISTHKRYCGNVKINLCINELFVTIKLYDTNKEKMYRMELEYPTILSSAIDSTNSINGYCKSTLAFFLNDIEREIICDEFDYQLDYTSQDFYIREKKEYSKEDLTYEK